MTLSQAQALLSCKFDSAEESNFGELRVTFGSGKDRWPTVSIYVDEDGVYRMGNCAMPSTASELADSTEAFRRATEFVERAKLRPR